MVVFAQEASFPATRFHLDQSIGTTTATVEEGRDATGYTLVRRRLLDDVGSLRCFSSAI